MARDYCCCAIPIVNFGIYLTLLEQFVVSVVAGTLAVATPRVVAYSAPSFGPTIFAIVCYVLAACQVLGAIAVRQEKSILFRRYTTLHGLLTLVAFSIAAVFIGISASHHTPATSVCETQFFDPASQTNGEGQIICNIFTWVGIGLLAGLWAVMGIMQGYLFFIMSSYGSSQRADHASYFSIGGPNGFALADRGGSKTTNDPWNARHSTDSLMDHSAGNVAGLGARGRSMRAGPSGSDPYSYEHARQDSTASYTGRDLPAGAAAPAAMPGTHSRKTTLDSEATYAPPRRARTIDENPTPVGSAYPAGYQHERKSSVPRRPTGDVRAPEASKFHPGQ